MIYLDMFKHLLPRAKAWSMTVNKQLREFFEGLTGNNEDVKDFYDNVYLDLFPQTTRELDAWEAQFGLNNSTLTEQGRRDRLEATWQAVGGQDPRYLQDTLQASGFDVYLHEWWVPGSEPAVGVKECVIARNPFLVLEDTGLSVIYIVGCGEPLAECGEVDAEAGNAIDPQGYALVNKILMTVRNYIVGCGEPLAECGEVDAEAGNYSGFIDVIKEYPLPVDADKWRYFLYIGGAIYGDLAQVDVARKEEFEELCLKICPNQQWLGIMVEYI